MQTKNLIAKLHWRFDPRCQWHRGDEPVEEGCGCQDCGKLIATKQCLGCGCQFIEWDDRNWDDVISGPYVTESGDLMCIPCGREADREVWREGEEYDDWVEYMDSGYHSAVLEDDPCLDDDEPSQLDDAMIEDGALDYD